MRTFLASKNDRKDMFRHVKFVDMYFVVSEMATQIKYVVM